MLFIGAVRKRFSEHIICCRANTGQELIEGLQIVEQQSAEYIFILYYKNLMSITSPVPGASVNTKFALGSGTIS